MEVYILDLLAEIKLERQNRRAAVPMQLPASSEELQQLREKATTILSYALPEAYLELLGLADGVDSNGFLLYASVTQPLAGHVGRSASTIEGFIEANLIWRDYEPNKKFMFFAESGDMVYCHNLTTSKFQLMDRITQEPDSESDVFDTCEEMLKKLLNHMLDRYEVE